LLSEIKSIFTRAKFKDVHHAFQSRQTFQSSFQSKFTNFLTQTKSAYNSWPFKPMSLNFNLLLDNDSLSHSLHRRCVKSIPCINKVSFTFARRASPVRRPRGHSERDAACERWVGVSLSHTIVGTSALSALMKAQNQSTHRPINGPWRVAEHSPIHHERQKRKCACCHQERVVARFRLRRCQNIQKRKKRRRD
jgi:hypothetical protein